MFPSCHVRFTYVSKWLKNLQLSQLDRKCFDSFEMCLFQMTEDCHTRKTVVKSGAVSLSKILMIKHTWRAYLERIYAGHRLSKRNDFFNCSMIGKITERSAKNIKHSQQEAKPQKTSRSLVDGFEAGFYLVHF